MLLGFGDLTHLIEDALHCEPQRAAPLAGTYPRKDRR